MILFTLVLGDRQQIRDCHSLQGEVEGWGQGAEGGSDYKGVRKLTGVVGVFEIFIWVKIFHVYVYVTTHQLLHFKYMQFIQFILCQLYLTETENKVFRVRSHVTESYFQFWAVKAHLAFVHLEEWDSALLLFQSFEKQMPEPTCGGSGSVGAVV